MADDDFTFAYRADTGEQVRIPKAHLEVFPGAFTLSAPRRPAGDTSARVATPKES